MLGCWGVRLGGTTVSGYGAVCQGILRILDRLGLVRIVGQGVVGIVVSHDIFYKLKLSSRIVPAAYTGTIVMRS